MKRAAALGVGNHDLVCWSHLRWSFVFQRPQHLMVRWARTRRVFFVEEPVRETGTPQSSQSPRLELRRDDSGVIVAVPHVPNGLTNDEEIAVLRKLCAEMMSAHEIRRPISWYYSPQFVPVARDVDAAVVVYDCMDELSAFRGAPKELITREAELLSFADVVLTGGQSLYEAKRDRHPNVHAFPSSVDVEHFAQSRHLGEDPDDQASIPRPRMGFHGVIDERMDLPLIDALAERLPEWHIVFIGPTAKIEDSALPRRRNIHYLGMKSYAELPHYLAGWDVAILPFALNEATRFISPTKTPEYMAGGRPIISTPIRDVVRPYGERGLAHIASDVDEFVAALEAIANEDPDERLRAYDAVLANMSWDTTFTRMVAAVDAAGHERDLRELAEREIAADI